MERDYDYSSAVFLEDLRNPAEVGQVAGTRTVRRLGARRPRTGRVPVVFAPRVARSLVGHLLAGINGGAIARGTSFLKDRMGEAVFAPGITIREDPHRPRGLKSRPCDAEGLATRPVGLVENGRLTTWLMDLRAARQLGLESTGHASRGPGSSPHPSASNVFLTPGAISPEDLVADIKDGFYVIELAGQGVNMVTGDYSRGAAGFWIENGEIAYPVNECTIAGSLPAMFANMTAADDLELRYGTDSPTLRVEGMTVAGAGAEGQRPGQRPGQRIESGRRQRAGASRPKKRAPPAREELTVIGAHRRKRPVLPSPSSRGLGHRPFTAATGVRIP